jgi:hypothetical protein
MLQCARTADVISTGVRSSLGRLTGRYRTDWDSMFACKVKANPPIQNNENDYWLLTAS